MPTPSEFQRWLARRAERLTQLSQALATGVPMQWGGIGESDSHARVFRDLGVEFVTATGAKKRGHRIKRGTKPAAIRRYPAPIYSAELYVFGVQTAPKETKNG